jgi:antitoxin ParD1/3/4
VESEYFRELVRRDQERKETAMAELRTMLERAEARGVSDRAFPDILEAARREARHKGLLRDEN